MRITQRIEKLRAACTGVFLLSMLTLSGGVMAASSSTQTPTLQPNAIRDAQPNVNPGLVAGLLSVTGLTTANTIGGTVSSFASTAGGLSMNFAGYQPGTSRFALPGQGETGAAAAPGGKAWNAWVSLSQNRVDYEFAPLDSSGTVDVAIVGVDYKLANNAIVGVAISGDRSDINLNYIGGTLKGRGTTVSPYLGVPIDMNWTFDASLGVGRTRLNMNMVGVDGSTTDDRNVANVGLSYRQLMNNWLFTGRGTYLTVRDKLGAYTMSDGTAVPEGTVTVSQVRFGGQAAYNAGWVVPHVGLTYVHDIKRPNQAAIGGQSPSNDRDAWLAVLGLQFKSQGDLYGGVQYTSETSRSQIKNDQIMFNLGVRF